jgi:hypothetical protein
MGTSGFLKKHSTLLAFSISLASSSVFVACGDDESVGDVQPYPDSGTGGAGASTGQTGGAPNTGGAKTGGAPGTGGAKTGGAPGTGGTNTGGANTGGANTGGGGANTGGTDGATDAPTSNGDAADALAPDGN